MGIVGMRSFVRIAGERGLKWRMANGEWRIWAQPAYTPLPPDSLHASENGHINSYAFANSLWFAVGEPGLISVWDTALNRWREIHRAPYAEHSFSGGGVGQDAPPPSQAEGRLYANSGAFVEFHTPAYGAVAVGNQIYFTYDSGVTWKRSFVPDTSAISSLMLLDTFALAGMNDGSLYYITNSGDDYLRCDSILYSQQSPSPYEGEGLGRGLDNAPEKSILQIGWKDSLNNELFALTDSVLYSLSADLHSSSSYNLPLRTGERAIGASFPSPYVWFLLTDSTKLLDTLTLPKASGHDNRSRHELRLSFPRWRRERGRWH